MTAGPDSVFSGILLTVAYDGTRFAGWAPQRDQRTIAGELLGALRAMHPAIREIRGASRTDAGVHARGQRAAFDDEGQIPPRGWVLGLMRHLPEEISIRRAARVPPGFMPRFDSLGKRYVYTLLRDSLRDPFWEHRAYRHDFSLDLEAMRTEAALLLGTHDFAAFRAAGDKRRDTVRTLRRVAIHVDPQDDRLWRVVVEGDRFLYNMVRIVVGTLLDVGRHRLAAGAVTRALVSGHRAELGKTAPADGLSLDDVLLANPGEDPWPPVPVVPLVPPATFASLASSLPWLVLRRLAPQVRWLGHKTRPRKAPFGLRPPSVRHDA